MLDGIICVSAAASECVIIIVLFFFRCCWFVLVIVNGLAWAVFSCCIAGAAKERRLVMLNGIVIGGLSKSGAQFSV